MAIKPIKVDGKANTVVKKMLFKEFPDFTWKSKVGDKLREFDIRLEELAALTGMRTSAVADVVHQKRSSVNIAHILVIAKALRITDLNELFELTMNPETRELFDKEREETLKSSARLSERMIKTMEDNQRMLELEREARKRLEEENAKLERKLSRLEGKKAIAQ